MKDMPVVAFVIPSLFVVPVAAAAVVVVVVVSLSSAVVSAAVVSFDDVSLVANDTIGVSIKPTSAILRNLFNLLAANSMHHLSAE
jgi:hypothetical protein